MYDTHNTLSSITRTTTGRVTGENDLQVHNKVHYNVRENLQNGEGFPILRFLEDSEITPVLAEVHQWSMWRSHWWTSPSPQDAKGGLLLAHPYNGQCGVRKEV